jgi:hypothetical protein
MRSPVVSFLLAFLVAAPGIGAFAESPSADDSRRLVLVELFTSQGCDMCPEAERQLGELAARNPRMVPIAFHVDYFNDPWKDLFSEPIHSQRQMAYNALYTKPKQPEYGLYYTPMLMIDGEMSINGRDRVGAQAAINRLMARKPQVSLESKLELREDNRSGEAVVKIRSRSARVEGKELLICAVVRDDGVVTHIGSGENADKTLSARFPARSMKYDFIRLDGKADSTLRFPFQLDPSWPLDRLDLVVFAQDKATGAILQSDVIPWKPRVAPTSLPTNRTNRRE